MNAEFVDRLFDQLSELFSRRDKPGRDEIRSLFSATVTAGLARMNLVTREEFEAQSALLARTREKLEALEKTLADLETGSS